MRILIIANWKMYLNNQETLALVESLVQAKIDLPAKLEVVICPNQAMLGQVLNLYDQKIKVGAQNVFWENQGAYTGEVGPENLKDLGCQYALIGHSERRQHLGETDEMVNRKLRAAISAGLTPVLCVGEDLAVRQAGLTEERVLKQLRSCLHQFKFAGSSQLVVAYEPIWAIYPAKREVDPIEIEKLARLIKEELVKLFGAATYQSKCRLIYGGSVDSKNLGKFLSLPTITGALVGHASASFEEFIKILTLASH